MTPSPVSISTNSKNCFCLYVKIQTVNLKTNSKTRDYITCTVYRNFLESFYFNAQQRLNEISLICLTTALITTTEITWTGYSTRTHLQIKQPIFDLFCIFGDFYASGRTRTHRSIQNLCVCNKNLTILWVTINNKTKIFVQYD